ncbi:MAG: exodeoxyribonuclease III, partial [Clostridia bacterium]|nr:exodeoxyribonuclease III [Clostridia bacterium]
PEERRAYSWWSYRMKARERNVGWRIDYFVTSRDLAPYIADSRILSEIHGSDHCPVELTLSLE